MHYKKQTRFRFSLLTMFLITTIVALTIALVTQSKTNKALREEIKPLRELNRDLQNQLGIFPEVNPNQVQVQLVDSSTGFRRVRIHLPKSRKYVLRLASGHMPVRKLPSPQWREKVEIEYSIRSSDVSSGEFTMDIRIEERDGQWLLSTDRLDSPVGGSKFSLSQHAQWLSDHRTWDVQSITRDAEVIPHGSPIVLFSLYRYVLKESEGGYSVTSAQDVADGLILWVEEGSL